MQKGLHKEECAVTVLVYFRDSHCFKRSYFHDISVSYVLSVIRLVTFQEEALMCVMRYRCKPHSYLVYDE